MCTFGWSQGRREIPDSENSNLQFENDTKFNLFELNTLSHLNVGAVSGNGSSTGGQRVHAAHAKA